MNPHSSSRYHNSGSGIFSGFDDFPRLFLGCHISASEDSLYFLTCDRQPEGTEEIENSLFLAYPV